MIVRTFEGLQALTTPPPPTWGASSSVNLYDHQLSYGEIYKRDSNMRIPIDFLMRNVAHLSPPQVFRRVSDTDRIRLTDHQLARWLKRPNPATTGYRLMETLMGDIGVYMEAFWLKVRYDDAAGHPQIGLVSLPPEEMGVEGSLLPTQFCWTTPNGRKRDFAPSEIVYFNGYNPINRLRGLSLFETLRSIVAEDDAAADHREGFWRNAARIEGVVTRPKEKARYSDAQMKSWREQWQAAHAGGAGAGKTILLQDGETFIPGSWSAKDSEYVAGMKLRREISGAGWHAPQPFIGILDHATFSNIREQHKNLYQDVLGPTFEMITQELERQLLPECDDQDNIYVEFNIAAKLAGSFEEQASSIQMAVGRPWMTVNEARAKQNLSSHDDPAADELAAQQGGPAAMPPADTGNPPPAPPPPADDTEDATAIAPVLHAARLRQQARLAKLPPGERAAAFFAASDRWNRELTEDLTPLVGAPEAARLAVEANAAMFMTLDAEETTA